MNVLAWINAGDDGRVNIAWYWHAGHSHERLFRTGRLSRRPAHWSLWMVQSLNAHAASPTFTAPILASEHHIHRGSVQTLIGGQNRLSSRALGDYLQMRMGAQGEAHIAYADSNNIIGSAAGHAMYVRQNGGDRIARRLLARQCWRASTPSTEFRIRAAMANTRSAAPAATTCRNWISWRHRFREVTTAPCSPAAPCYKIVMQIEQPEFRAHR